MSCDSYKLVLKAAGVNKKVGAKVGIIASDSL